MVKRDVLPKDSDIKIEFITDKADKDLIGDFDGKEENERRLSEVNDYDFRWECIR